MDVQARPSTNPAERTPSRAPTPEPSWRTLDDTERWRSIPAWADVPRGMFLDHRWQEAEALTKPGDLRAVLGDRVSDAFLADLEAGLARSPMSLRLSPYLASLVDWDDPVADPLRRQFLPLGSEAEPDHPLLSIDANREQADAPVEGITHRYPDRVLFLPTDRCPVYCRYCTRSYAIGLDTPVVAKRGLAQQASRWEAAFAWLEAHPEVEDVVVSGGDAFRLKPAQIRAVGARLLAIPHVRRFRFATKGLAVQPMKLLSDADWTAAIVDTAEAGRRLHKQVAVHTHFNHPREITAVTEAAVHQLVGRGIVVRNQSVLLRGVNDDLDVHLALLRRLAWIGIQPYYTYVGDLVPGVEDLRTSVARGEVLSKAVRGALAGFNTPLFVVDAPGGGGKRDVFSHERYDRETGLAVYAAPSVRPGALFLYADPLRTLSADIRRRWADERCRREMVEDALAAARRDGA